MISVVIICLDEATYIEKCLDSIAVAADEVTCEIVIVDGGSRDDTIALCHAWASASSVPLLVVGSAPGYARQRNAGVRAAQFGWIAFVSADVRVPSDWLREIAASAHDGADLLIGPFDLVPDDGRGAWMAPLARTVYPPVTGDAVERCSSVNLVVRREVLCGHPFDEEIVACEDKDFAARALAPVRNRVAMRLTARPQHLARETFTQWLRKLYREALSLTILSRRRSFFPDCFGWRAHARRAFLLVLFAIVVGSVGSPPLAGAAAVAAIVAACVHDIGWPRSGRSPFLHALSMLAITAGVCAGAIVSLHRHTGDRSFLEEAA